MDMYPRVNNKTNYFNYDTYRFSNIGVYYDHRRRTVYSNFVPFLYSITNHVYFW